MKKSKRDKKIEEDAVIAGREAPSDVMSGPGNAGLSADDILGKGCDHHRDGYLGDGCFHVPQNVLGFGGFLSRLQKSKKKKKNSKNPYLKGMKMISDSELSRDFIRELQHLHEDYIEEFIISTYGLNNVIIYSIAYFPVDKSLFIKFRISGKSDFRYVNVDYENGEFIAKSDEVYARHQAMKIYKQILQMPGNSPENIGSEDFSLWVVWGQP